jgi:flagellar basal-body rod modification protein FlgD
MATTVSGLSGTDASQAAYGAPADSSGKTGLEKDLVGKDDFLRLLVAQIRNQNPLNPADGVEFLTQLAQFTSLEQLIGIRTQLEALTASGVTQLTPADGSEGSGTAGAV